MRDETDYILGTHDAEIARLRLQHGVWRAEVLDCWRRAGIGPGQTVVDIGCGPGFASVDLAETVGPQGAVIGIERSPRFIEQAEALCAARGIGNATFRQRDVMSDALDVSGADAVWCRWLAIFLSDPGLLVRKMAGALKPGGRLVFHEYVHYETYQSAPASARLAEFVQHVMASWRESGGEPNVARELPRHLGEAGCRILSSRPISFSASPADPLWRWPASFIEVNLQRLLELGRVDADWAAAVQADLRTLESDANALLITPMVLEIIAEKEP